MQSNALHSSASLTSHPKILDNKVSAGIIAGSTSIALAAKLTAHALLESNCLTSNSNWLPALNIGIPAVAGIYAFSALLLSESVQKLWIHSQESLSKHRGNVCAALKDCTRPYGYETETV